MDPSFPNFYLNLGDYGDSQNSQYYQNTPIYSNPSQVRVSENLQTSQSSEKQPRGNKWDVAEDVALMSSWCHVSENSICGKNQKFTSLWTQVKKLYDEARAKNPEKLGERNVEQMKGRYKRLNESVQKWIGAYREAHRHIKSGMSPKDVESEAHKIYEQEVKNKFNDSVVFNEVMCHHPKWELQINRETTRSRQECEVECEESGGSTKKSRTTEEGDYSNQETPNSGASTIQRPIGRNAAKAKAKGKASNSVVEELRAFRLSKETENELFKRKLDMEPEREEKQLKKMQLKHLNTLLGRQYLSPEEEDIKKFLMSKFYGN